MTAVFSRPQELGEGLHGDLLGHGPGQFLLLLKFLNRFLGEPPALHPQQLGGLLQIPGPEFQLRRLLLARTGPLVLP